MVHFVIIAQVKFSLRCTQFYIAKFHLEITAVHIYTYALLICMKIVKICLHYAHIDIYENTHRYIRLKRHVIVTSRYHNANTHLFTYLFFILLHPSN